MSGSSVYKPPSEHTRRGLAIAVRQAYAAACREAEPHKEVENLLFTALEHLDVPAQGTAIVSEPAWNAAEIEEIEAMGIVGVALRSIEKVMATGMEPYGAAMFMSSPLIDLRHVHRGNWKTIVALRLRNDGDHAFGYVDAIRYRASGEPSPVPAIDDPAAKDAALVLLLREGMNPRAWVADYELTSKGQVVNVQPWREDPERATDVRIWDGVWDHGRQ